MKAVGGVLVGLVMASFLIILLWRGADALSARRPAFRHWYQPRRLHFRVGLTLASLCFGAAAGFGSANFKPGPNKKDWLTPKDSPLVDKELEQAEFAGKETFLGVTKSRRWIRLSIPVDADAELQVYPPQRIEY